MMRTMVLLSGIGLLQLFAAPLQGAILVDNGLSTIAANGMHSSWSNNAVNWTLWDNFSLTGDAVVTGGSFVFVTAQAPAAFTFEIRKDQGGTLGDIVHSVTSFASVQTTSTGFAPGGIDRYDFELLTPLALDAGSYWTSFNGYFLIGWQQISGGDGIIQRQTSDGTVFFRDVGTNFIPFELRGELQAEAVPEPGSLCVFCLGVLGIAVTRRRRSLPGLAK